MRLWMAVLYSGQFILWNGTGRSAIDNHRAGLAT
jgi:hypothetical protein